MRITKQIKREAYKIIGDELKQELQKEIKEVKERFGKMGLHVEKSSDNPFQQSFVSRVRALEWALERLEVYGEKMDGKW